MVKLSENWLSHTDFVLSQTVLDRNSGRNLSQVPVPVPAGFFISAGILAGIFKKNHVNNLLN